MTSNFKLYSAYYDLLYQDKDYKAEAAYVQYHLKNLLPEAKKLLELGSGTGNHARYLSEYGYEITGVERSEEMIALAKQKAITDFQPVLSDITNFNFEYQFDAAVSLFHSMCYLTTNEQLLTSFNNVSRHLKAGGIFAFDCWYGPAVLHHLPIDRTKYQQNKFLEVRRQAQTTMHINKNIAEVNYEMLVRDKANGKHETIIEKHPMRYLSMPEIELIAHQTGFNVIAFEEFLTGNEPTLESWNVLVILQKTASV